MYTRYTLTQVHTMCTFFNNIYKIILKLYTRYTRYTLCVPFLIILINSIKSLIDGVGRYTRYMCSFLLLFFKLC